MAKITSVSDDEAPPTKNKTTLKSTPPSTPKTTTTPKVITSPTQHSQPTTTSTTNTNTNINIDNGYLSDEEELLEELEEPDKLFCNYHDCPKTEHDSEDFESDSQSSESDTEARLKSSKLLVRKKKVNEKNGNNIYQSDCFIRQLANKIPDAFNEFGKNYTGTLVDSDNEANSTTNVNNSSTTTTNKKKPNSENKIEYHFYSSKPLSLLYEPSHPDDKLFPKHYKTENNSRNLGAKKSKDHATNTTTTTASVINNKKDKLSKNMEEEEGYGNFYNDYIDSFDKFDEYDERSEDESFISHPHLYRKRELIPAFKRELTAKFIKTTKKPVKPAVDVGKPFVDDPNDCFHPMYREVDQGFHLCANRSLLITKLLKSKVSQSSIFKKVKNPLLATKDHSMCEKLYNYNGNSTPKQKRNYCWQNTCNSDTEDEKRIQESSSTIKQSIDTTSTTKKISLSDDDEDDDDDDDEEDQDEDLDGHLDESEDQVEDENIDEEEHIDSDVDDYPKKPTVAVAPPTQVLPISDEDEDENAPPKKPVRKGGKTGDVDSENEGPKNCKNQ